MQSETVLLINLGAEMCARIKNLYFAHDEWSMCTAKRVAHKFSAFRKWAKKSHPNLTEIQLAKMLRNYSDEDIQDCFAMEVKNEKEVVSQIQKQIDKI